MRTLFRCEAGHVNVRGSSVANPEEDLGCSQPVVKDCEWWGHEPDGRHCHTSTECRRPLMSVPIPVEPSSPDALLSLKECAQLAARPDDWRTLDLDVLAQLTLNRCLVFGQISAWDLPEEVTQEADDQAYAVYRVANERLPRITRIQLLDAVTDAIEQNGAVSALMPFMDCDHDVAIAREASIRLAMMMPRIDGDLLTGPKALRRLADSADSETVRLGLLLGLMSLGDRQTSPMLEGCWRTLTALGRRKLTEPAPFAYASSIDFFLDWFPHEQDEIGQLAIANALARPARDALEATRGPTRDRHLLRVQRVLDVERVYPASEAMPGTPIRILREWSLKDYWKLLEPRLRELAAVEIGSEQVIPGVMADWRAASEMTGELHNIEAQLPNGDLPIAESASGLAEAVRRSGSGSDGGNMSKQSFVLRDVLLYLADHPRSPQEEQMRQIQAIELWKEFDKHGMTERAKPGIGAFLTNMMAWPSYTPASDVAKAFNQGGLLATVGFRANLIRFSEMGVLHNPVGDLFGISPRLLMEMGLWELAQADVAGAAGIDGPPPTTPEIWAWVRQQIELLPGSDRSNERGEVLVPAGIRREKAEEHEPGCDAGHRPDQRCSSRGRYL